MTVMYSPQEHSTSLSALVPIYSRVKPPGPISCDDSVVALLGRSDPAIPARMVTAGIPPGSWSVNALDHGMAMLYMGPNG